MALFLHFWRTFRKCDDFFRMVVISSDKNINLRKKKFLKMRLLAHAQLFGNVSRYTRLLFSLTLWDTKIESCRILFKCLLHKKQSCPKVYFLICNYSRNVPYSIFFQKIDKDRMTYIIICCCNCHRGNKRLSVAYLNLLKCFIRNLLLKNRIDKFGFLF